MSARIIPCTLLLVALACGSEPGTTDSTGTSDTSGTGHAVTETGSSSGTDAAESSGTADASTTDGTSTGAPTTTDAPTTGDSTTGEPAWCYGWQGDDGGAPFLELYNGDVLLAEGGVLNLECGPQGLFMFGLYPKFGGFTPDDDSIGFAVTVDVEGHNINPQGHFYSTPVYQYYVGCSDIIGGVLGVVPVFPPDNDDPLLLDGLPAEVHVVLTVAGETIDVQFTATLAVDPNGMFEFCQG